jgi:hypothetical protein
MRLICGPLDTDRSHRASFALSRWLLALGN